MPFKDPEKNRASNLASYYKHHEERKAAMRAHYAAHRGQYRSYGLKKFGLTPETYAALLASQDGKCAICGLPQNGEALAVDHGHETGKMRGLIHRKCNTAIGLLNDDPALLRAAIVYLEKANG